MKHSAIGKQLLKLAALFLGLLAVLTSGLCLTANIPQSAVAPQIQRSIDKLEGTELFPPLIGGLDFSKQDNYADVILLNIIYNVDPDHPLSSVLAADYVDDEYADADDGERYQIQDFQSTDDPASLHFLKLASGKTQTTWVDFNVPSADDSGENEIVRKETAYGEAISELPEHGEKTGYTFGWYTDAACTTPWDAGSVVTEPIGVYGKWTKVSSPVTYTLSFETNGGTALGGLTRVSGTTIDLSGYTPARTGYTFAGWYSDSALTEAVSSVSLSRNTTVYAKWEKSGLSFTDVAPGDWFYDDVAYVHENKLMSGDGASFSPKDETTRGMMVTLLYRMEGEPAVTGACPFDDAAPGSYYENAIIWAAANNIVGGYGNGKFGPDDSITREQMAGILYRYAAFKGYDVTASADLTKFSDSAQISSYSVTAMAWANAVGLVTGRGDGTIDPAGSALRCEAAALLHRFCVNIAK